MATTDEVTRDVRANDSNDDDSAEESYKVGGRRVHVPASDWCECGHLNVGHRTNESGSCMIGTCGCRKFVPRTGLVNVTE